MQQERCQRDPLQKRKVLEGMSAGEMGNTFWHICSSHDHTAGMHYLVLSKCRVKLHQTPGGDRKAQPIMTKKKN